MCWWKVIVFPYSDGKWADSYIAYLARIAIVRVKSCGVVVRALSGAVWLLHRPLLPLDRPELVAILGGKLISGYIISHVVCGRYGI